MMLNIWIVAQNLLLTHTEKNYAVIYFIDVIENYN